MIDIDDYLDQHMTAHGDASWVQWFNANRKPPTTGVQTMPETPARPDHDLPTPPRPTHPIVEPDRPGLDRPTHPIVEPDRERPEPHDDPDADDAEP